MGLLVSIIVYISPFGAIEAVPASTHAPQPAATAARHYRVIIPYQDPVIVAIAPARLRERYFARIESDVAAQSVDEAKTTALKRFLASTESIQVNIKSGKNVEKRSEKKVEYQEHEILAFER